MPPPGLRAAGSAWWLVRVRVPRCGPRVPAEEAKLEGAALAAAGAIGARDVQCLPGVDAARLSMAVRAPDGDAAIDAVVLHVVAYALACADAGGNWDPADAAAHAEPA